MPWPIFTLVTVAATPLLATAAPAQMTVASQAELKHFDVTIRRFDPSQGAGGGQVFVLPVDSPDEEHAAASTLSNAISFSKKTEGGRALPVAFMVVAVKPRPSAR